MPGLADVATTSSAPPAAPTRPSLSEIIQRLDYVEQDLEEYNTLVPRILRHASRDDRRLFIASLGEIRRLAFQVQRTARDFIAEVDGIENLPFNRLPPSRAAADHEDLTPLQDVTNIVHRSTTEEFAAQFEDFHAGADEWAEEFAEEVIWQGIRVRDLFPGRQQPN